MVDNLTLSSSDSSFEAKRCDARDLDKCLHVKRVLDSDIDYDDTIAYQNNTVTLNGQ